MSIITKQVGQRIKETRKAKGLTQKELGEMLGVSESAVNRYEGGTQNLTVGTLQKIATALNATIILQIDPE